MKKVLLLLLLLTGAAWAQTLFVDGHEIPYRMVDGKQMVKKADLAKVFPKLAEEEGMVDVASLADHPDARVTKRDGIVTRIKYYNSAAATIYEGVRQDTPPPKNGTVAAQPPSVIKISVSGRSKTTSPVPDRDAHILSVTVTNGSDQPLSLNARALYVLDEEGKQHFCQTDSPLRVPPGASVRRDGLTFNVPKRNTIKSIHLENIASSRL